MVFFYIGEPSFSTGTQTDEVTVDHQLVAEGRLMYETKTEIQSAAEHEPKHVEFLSRAVRVFVQDEAIYGMGLSSLPLRPIILQSPTSGIVRRSSFEMVKLEAEAQPYNSLWVLPERARQSWLEQGYKA